MPYQIRKVRNKDCYMVRNIETGRVSAKCTTREKAKRQVSLLNSIDDKKQIPKPGSPKPGSPKPKTLPIIGDKVYFKIRNWDDKKVVLGGFLVVEITGSKFQRDLYNKKRTKPEETRSSIEYSARIIKVPKSIEHLQNFYDTFIYEYPFKYPTGKSGGGLFFVGDYDEILELVKIE